MKAIFGTPSQLFHLENYILQIAFHIYSSNFIDVSIDRNQFIINNFIIFRNYSDIELYMCKYNILICLLVLPKTHSKVIFVITLIKRIMKYIETLVN